MTNSFLFKSNINCGNCKKKVSLKLDSNPQILQWEVDLEHPDRLLKVESELEAEELIKIVKTSGFQLTEIKF